MSKKLDTNCKTCYHKHLNIYKNLHCYMFKDKPNGVCMQHTGHLQQFQKEFQLNSLEYLLGKCDGILRLLKRRDVMACGDSLFQIGVGGWDMHDLDPTVRTQIIKLLTNFYQAKHDDLCSKIKSL